MIINDVTNMSQEEMLQIKDAIGVVGLLHIIELFDNGGEGDYTLEKYLENEKQELSDEEIYKLFGIKHD